MNTINVRIPDPQELINYFIFQFKESGWFNLMKGFLLSSDFKLLVDKIIHEVREDRRFTPKFKDSITTFKLCKYDNLKVVMLCGDPNQFIGIANGIAFSNTNCEQIILDSANAHEGHKLIDWCKQGVLLLNNPLTTQIEKVNTHTEIWRPFINYFINMLNDEKRIFVFLGEKAKSYEELLDADKHSIFRRKSPISAMIKYGSWNSYNMFEEINEILGEENKIIW